MFGLGTKKGTGQQQVVGQQTVTTSGVSVGGGLFGPAAEFSTTQTTVAQPVVQQSVDPSQNGIPVPTTQQPGGLLNPSVHQNVSALAHLDARSTQALSQAQRETQRIAQTFIEPEQILYGLLFDEQIFSLLNQFSVDAAKLSSEIQSKEQQGNSTGQPALSEASKQVFENAYLEAKKRNSDFVTPEDILLTLFNGASAQVLQSHGLQKDKIQETLAKNPEFAGAGKKSALQQFGIDLTEAAKSGKLDPITGRDREVERVVHILLRRTKNNPIIIGEAGTGKTAIVEGLAQAIVNGTAPKDLLNRKIIQLDVSSMVAGASHRGEFEERLRSVIKETMAASGTVVLFIDEIHTLIGAGDTGGAMDASNIIKPFLARGQLQIIGTTTTAEYRKYFEKDKAFERRFQPVICEEPSEETAIKMLEILKPKYEKFHSVTFMPDAVEASVKLSKRYIGERYLPDKAVDLLDEAAAEVRLEHNQGKRQDNQVKKADIENVVSNWTGIPITKLTENESEKLLRLEDLIHKRLIDQEAAVAAVAEAVRRGRIGLASANRPIASFIFLGPTGTGKTELAKTLAEILFGRDDAMIRLDMSEYMEKHEVAKLIGAPPGYVGYEEGGQLTEAVRAKPYSVVLLDEVEKAHPDVFNILLQLLEDGRLTDNKGNTISFKNTIIIATSNIGSALIQQQLLESKSKTALPGTAQTPTGTQLPTNSQTTDKDAKKFKELKDVVMNELRKFFKPELINRFDEVIMFEPLSQKDMTAITKLNMEKTRKMLLEQQVDLVTSEGALSQLAKEGYDPVYGARPLRRLIQIAIENPLALLLIQKKFVAGDRILIDYDNQNQKFTFTKAQTSAQVPGNVNAIQTVNMPANPATNNNPGVNPVPANNRPNQAVNDGLLTPAQPTNPVSSGYGNGFPSPQTLPNSSNGTAMQPVN